MTALKCGWCGVAVTTPQRGWELGHVAYCADHAVIAGRNPWSVGQIALGDAVDLQDADPDSMLRWPWQSVDELAGILVPRRVYYIAAFPGNGKTSFLAECFASWLEQGHRVTYLPLESDPLETMTRAACARIGVSADDALSLRLRRRADGGDAQARHDLARLHATFTQMRKDNDFLNQFRIDPTEVLSPSKFRDVIRAVEAMESDCLIVDHVDHAEADAGDNSPALKSSNKIQKMALDAARHLDIPVVLASQLNSSRTGGDRLAHYRPPIMDWLANKEKKEHIGAVCLGLYRPIDPARVADIADVRSGLKEAAAIAKSGRMGVAGMKLRFGGDRKEKTVELVYKQGKLTDVPSMDAWSDEAHSHGIRTNFEGR